MKIWVDADAVPREIADIIIRAAQRVQIKAVFVANKFIRLPLSPFVSLIQVHQGADVADAEIARCAQGHDFVITADIPLAAILVAKGVLAVNPRGELYTEANIRERLSMRDFMSDLRSTGVITGGPKPFDDKAKARFASTFDALLTKHLRAEALSVVPVPVESLP